MKWISTETGARFCPFRFTGRLWQALYYNLDWGLCTYAASYATCSVRLTKTWAFDGFFMFFCWSDSSDLWNNWKWQDVALNFARSLELESAEAKKTVMFSGKFLGVVSTKTSHLKVVVSCRSQDLLKRPGLLSRLSLLKPGWSIGSRCPEVPNKLWNGSRQKSAIESTAERREGSSSKLGDTFRRFGMFWLYTDVYCIMVY